MEFCGKCERVSHIAMLEINLLLLWSITKCVVCDIITPKSVPPDIMLYKSNLTSSQIQNLEKHFKPWMVYIDSSLKYSINKCLIFNSGTENSFGKTTTCLFHCSPSCKFWRAILSHVCPLDNHISYDKENRIPEFKIYETQKLPPIEFVFQKLIIDTERCPMLHKRSYYTQYLNNVHYFFKPDIAMRVNVTFLLFKLTYEEKVQLMNLDENDHRPYSLYTMQLYYPLFLEYMQV